MKNRTLLIILFWVWSFCYASAQSFNLDTLEATIPEMMKDFDVPGLSIAIVQNDSVLFMKGYGTREINQDFQVDEHTIFGIGSISKSFTVLTLGILVDEGKINWDDRVKDYLPYFELYDPYVTDHFTIGDLITHRSGLRDVSGGTLWYHSNLTKEEVIRQLKYLEPVSGFREKPAYQNVMFEAAGLIVEKVSGVSWNKFLQNRVFDKIGMINSTSLSKFRESNSNLAQPHILNENFQQVSIIQEKGDNIAEAMGIYSSANDMANYMKLLLNDGVFDGDTIVSKSTTEEIFTPQTLYQLDWRPLHNEFSSYGFGWWLTPIQGHKVIDHSGGIDGMTANLIMIKDLNIGIVILSNAYELVSLGLSSNIAGKILNDTVSINSYQQYKGYRENLIAQKKEKGIKNDSLRIRNTNPSLKLEELTGEYIDEMYGKIHIYKLKDNELEISFSHTPIFSGKLIHWHFDTFKIDWHDIRVPDGFLTFNFNAHREITGIKLEQENLLDVDFNELEIKRLEPKNKIKS